MPSDTYEQIKTLGVHLIFWPTGNDQSCPACDWTQLLSKLSGPICHGKPIYTVDEWDRLRASQRQYSRSNGEASILSTCSGVTCGHVSQNTVLNLKTQRWLVLQCESGTCANHCVFVTIKRRI